MFSSWYFILLIIVLDSVDVHSDETTDKTYDVNKKNVTGVAKGNGGKMLLNGKREVEDFDDLGDGNRDISYSQGGQHSSSQDELQSGSETDEETSDDAYNDDSLKGDKKGHIDIRPLQSGDTLTPYELLPIATKLLKKVSEKARGIVSSAKSPEHLSDKLFEAYFMTTRRIVFLTDKDLSGLDALQALALEGEAVEMRTSGNSITENPEQIFLLNGQLVGVDPILRCHYKLIFKKVSPSDSVLRIGQSGRIPPFTKILKLEKKMSPNRHLVINQKSRKSNKENNNLKKGVRLEKNAANEEEVEMLKKDGEQKKSEVSKKGKKKVKKLKSKHKLKHRQNKSGLARDKKLKKQRKKRKKNSKSKFTENLKHLRNKNIDLNLPVTTTQRPVCKWRYICKIPGDLDTCRLHTSCYDGKNNKPMLDDKYVDTEGKRNKAQEELVMHFRKMLGFTALDEEVEKILEQHVMLVKPENLRPSNKIESLDDYFNNIIMAQHLSTTPGYGSSESIESTTPHPMFGLVFDTTPQREDLRKIDGEKAKMKSTPLSNIRDPQNVHKLSESTMITTPRYNKRYLK